MNNQDIQGKKAKQAEYQKEYRIRNKERLKEYYKQYYAKNSEKLKAYYREKWNERKLQHSEKRNLKYREKAIIKWNNETPSEQ